MKPTNNENGVYQAGECLELARPVKGWKGGPIGEIALAKIGSYWIWSTGFQLWGGDCWGSSSPLMDLQHYRAPTRADAIEAASNKLRKRLSDRAGTCRDAKAIIDWLDNLAPDQLDLFAA